MVNDLFTSNNDDYLQIIKRIALLKDDSDCKDFFKTSLDNLYQNLKEAENNIVKYTTKVLIFIFLYTILINTQDGVITFSFVTIKDLSGIKIFFPTIILYYSLLIRSNEIYRLECLYVYYPTRESLYAGSITDKMSELFKPFSLHSLFSNSVFTSKWLRYPTNLSYIILFFFIHYCGILAFIYNVWYAYETKKLNFFFWISFLVQLTLVLITISTSARKKRFVKNGKQILNTKK